MWKDWRSAGILLHPTSLPSPYGIGDIGPLAYSFAEVLREMGQSVWQVLPLGPTSYGDSPYQSPSTFAGNPLLISPDVLLEDGLLTQAQHDKIERFPVGPVDFGHIIPKKMKLLQTVCKTFMKRADEAMLERFETFCSQHAYWLDDYSLFMSIKAAQGGGSFTEWPAELIQRQPKALKAARTKNKTAIRNVKIMQFLFADQWHRLRAFCNDRGIQVVGDIPIFVAHDSADVWAHPELFYVDAATGQLEVQAGVPPDYFSATGQLWGNPLYNWDVHREQQFSWWCDRIRNVFEMVDILRIDHFRGFESYWEVDADAETAIHGKWVPGPKDDLFARLNEVLGPVQIIAEDLGIITDEVEALRDRFEFPGMRVLQFAFGNDAKAEDYRPHNYPLNCFVYTGTHDNDTVVGWFNSEAGEGSTRSQEEIDEERQCILSYTKTWGESIEWDMISLAYHSAANTAIIPLQDLMGLGSEARLNTPGQTENNWSWRFTWDMLPQDKRDRLRAITQSSDRITH